MDEVSHLDGVSVKYSGEDGLVALRGACLTLLAGEYVTLTGPSGSGKSTLLNVLGLLITPTAGTYRLDGGDVGQLSDSRRADLRAQHLSFVFQAFHLIPWKTSLENVALALSYQGIAATEARDRATKALERVGLEHRVRALPSTLSGGERQRVAVARALVRRPLLVLCDEPTGNLDSASSEAVLSLLDEVHGAGSTVVVSTHNHEVAARGTRRLALRDGELSEPQ